MTGFFGLRLNGHPSFVRPLILPMSVGAAEAMTNAKSVDDLTEDEVERIKAASSAAENYGNFYGQNLSPVQAGILLVFGVMNGLGYTVNLLSLVYYTIPIVLFSIVLGAIQFFLLDEHYRKKARAKDQIIMQAISSVAGWVFSLQAVYVLVGLVLVIFATMTFRDRGNPRRVGSGLFWVILGLIFIAGGLLPHWLTGMLVLLMVALDGTGQVRRGSSTEVSKAEQEKEAARLGNKIFLPVLVIPLVTFAFAAAFKIAGADMNRGALVGLGFGGVAGAAVALRLTRSSAAHAIR